MARLKFHQKTFELLQLAPLPSDANRQALEKAARSSAHPLPAAALEWLALENGLPLLRRPGDAEPRTLKTLVESLQAMSSGQKQRLIFLSDKQGNCWGFDLTADDDPPVLIRLPTEDGESWRTNSERFSDFIYGWLWDRPAGGHTARAQVSCTLKQIRRLASGAEEQPISKAWPTHKTFRLQFKDGRMRIHYRPDGWSEVVLWSDNAKSLARLVSVAAAGGAPAKAFFSDQPAVSRLLASL